jgi:hypothetical protein
MIIRVPRPEVKFALLVNGATGIPTPHKYIETVECTLPYLVGDDGSNTVGGPAWLFLFECETTGIQRVWGVEDRALSSFDEPFKCV